MSVILFLPGAAGSADFWKPVSDRLPASWTRHHLHWPGLGNEPHHPNVNGIEDLVDLTLSHVDRPVDVVAQSMGGYVAAILALRHPELVRSLVLAATSAGINMDAAGAADWRPEYRCLFPGAAEWICDERVSSDLPVEDIAVPTLLIWGDADEISPLPVGTELARRMPDATLKVIPHGDHDFANTHPDRVARLILEHLTMNDCSSPGNRMQPT